MCLIGVCPLSAWSIPLVPTEHHSLIGVCPLLAWSIPLMTQGAQPSIDTPREPLSNTGVPTLGVIESIDDPRVLLSKWVWGGLFLLFLRFFLCGPSCPPLRYPRPSLANLHQPLGELDIPISLARLVWRGMEGVGGRWQGIAVENSGSLSTLSSAILGQPAPPCPNPSGPWISLYPWPA